MFSLFTRTETTEPIKNVEQGDKRYLHTKGILGKLIPKNHRIPHTQYDKLIYIDKMAVNINREKERILIAKGLHNSQFNLLNNIIVILSLIIAGINLIGSALDSQERKYIGQSTEVVFEIIVGIFGLVIAVIAKMRDQKEDLVHSMLTAVNQCDDFLNDIENKVANYIRNMISSKDRFNYPENSDEDINIENEEYKKILIECDKVMAKFSSEDAQAVTNGGIYCCQGLLCCFFYDPQPLRNLMTKYNENSSSYDYNKYCMVEFNHLNSSNDLKFNKDFQINGDVKVDGNILLTGKAYGNDVDLVIQDPDDTTVSIDPDINVTGASGR